MNHGILFSNILLLVSSDQLSLHLQNHQLRQQPVIFSTNKKLNYKEETSFTSAKILPLAALMPHSELGLEVTGELEIGVL